MPDSPSGFDRSQVEERFADASEDLPYFLDGAKSDPRNLSLLISTALDVACCGVALKVDFELVRQGLQIAGQASAAIFQLVSSDKLPVEVPLGEGHSCVFDARPDESTVHAFQWVRGFFLNAICRETDLVDMMCRTPTKLLRQSSTKDPEYRYLFVDALRAFWAGESQCNKLILAALDATDPERGDVQSVDWTLKLDVPLLQLLFYLNSNDDDFAVHFPQAVKLHQQFWSSSDERRKNWERFLAIELTGLAALAHDRGLSFHLDAESIPDELVCGFGK
ncbi:immunity 49 family protein [Gimesia panareensis]|uniref:immunity 49 family protein n=1 Tax=Gimesia panareensis TaxID=2527978 RepID=UPI0011883A84|nr:immunity 49 family protein [Gimesia panareensis]QDU49457.1 hypothetical protein Pan110_17940 [Gimesia panareensis]